MEQNGLSSVQSGFHKGEVSLLFWKFEMAQDAKHHYAAIYIGLMKEFDSVDHSILLNRIDYIGVSSQLLVF